MNQPFFLSLLKRCTDDKGEAFETDIFRSLLQKDAPSYSLLVEKSRKVTAW